MIPVIPWYITAVVVSGAVILIIAVWQLFALAASRSGLTREGQTPVLFGVGAYLLLWFVAVLLASPSLASLAGADPYALTLVIPFFAVAGPLVAFVAYRRFESFRQVLNALPLPGVIGVQTFRVLGATFIVLLAQGQLPAHFALPAGWGDVAVGLVAPVVALLLARGTKWPALIWNVVGLTDLITAVGMGTGIATPFLVPGVTSRLPAAAAMGAFPMILVPAFAVPIAMMLHLVSLRGILTSDERAPDMVPAH
jgi:hypothetical protein